MDPIITKILEGVPYNGMGTTLERNGLIGVIRNLIEQDRYTVDYILNYAESVGYQRQMAEEVFKELTGLSPVLIVNNNEYYKMPAYVPNMCIAWGTSKSNKEKAFYVVPFEYGYAVMEKDEVNAPVPTVISATIPEAIDELKKVAKGIQTLDKIITKKLLETEEVQTVAETPHQVNKPYSASPLQILKKNFKDKVINVSEFERQASKLLASEEITVDEAEDLMAWKQDLIDEDETYGNDVLELDEQWKPLDAEVDDDDFNGYHSSEEYLNSYEYLYETLVTGNIDLYKEKLNKLSKAELMDYIAWAEEMGIGREELKLHYITASKKMATFDNVKYSLNDALIILKNNGLEYKDLEEVKETSSNPKEMKQALSTAIERIKKSGIDAEESLKGYTEDLNNTSDEFVSFPKTENEMKELYNRLLNDEVLQFNPMEQLYIGESKQKIDEGVLYLYYRGHGQYAVDPTYENFKQLVKRIENKKSASKKQASKYKGFTYDVDENGVMKIFTPDNRIVSEISDCKNCDKSTLENIFYETLDNSSFGKKKSSKISDKMKERLTFGYFSPEQEKSLQNFNSTEELESYIKQTNSFPDNFFYKGGLFTMDEYDMSGSTISYSSPEIDMGLWVDTPDNRYDHKGDYKNMEISIEEENGPLYRNDITYYLPKSVYDSIYGNKTASKKKASKKVTAENMTLDDIEAEDNKDTVQEEIDKINEKPAEEVFSETTPEQYFEDALAEDKVDTINEVVSRCIDKFSEKFKDFDKYNVEILSYNTKVLGDYKPTEEEMVEDKELNANAILQVILAITNNADESNMKKALAVFSVANGELHWTGTVRGENDQVVAFTEEGLDALFEVEEPSEEELEDIV